MKDHNMDQPISNSLGNDDEGRIKACLACEENDCCYCQNTKK